MSGVPRISALLAVLALVAALAGVVPVAPAGAQAQAATGLRAGYRSAESIDRDIGRLRVGIAVLALAVFAAGLRRAGRAGGRAEARRIALGLLAATAFLANYNFFVWTGFHRHELYHYYLGSKYFPELGYFRLYECSIEAKRAQGGASVPAEITDLRSKRRRPALEVLAAARPCAPDFTPARWAEFQGDVTRFVRVMGERGWTGMLSDHGYNPSPVWTLVGRPIAEAVTPDARGLWLIARLDLVVLAALFAAVAWAFGFEAMCLAMIAWGACGHTRYQWTGDAFLRHMWLASALGAICLVKRGREAAGGAWLAFSAGLRVFPALFFAGWAVREAAQAIGQRRLRPGAVRFAAGAAVTGVLLAGAATAVSGRGLGAWQEFVDNTAAQISFTPRNALGLDYLLQYSGAPPSPEIVASTPNRQAAIQEAKWRTAASRRWLQGLALVVFAALFVRAAVRAEEWEAIAVGALLIPVLTMPGSYYLGFVLVGAPLATRRPRIGVALLAAVVGWSASLAFWPEGPKPYVLSSAVLLAFCLWTLLELQWPARVEMEPARCSR